MTLNTYLIISSNSVFLKKYFFLKISFSLISSIKANITPHGCGLSTISLSMKILNKLIQKSQSILDYLLLKVVITTVRENVEDQASEVEGYEIRISDLVHNGI